MIRASMRAQREAERRYPVRVRIAVPPEGLGHQLEIMHAWLDETCGAKGWASAPAGTTGIVNDALGSISSMPPSLMPSSPASVRLPGRDDCGCHCHRWRRTASAAQRACS